MKHLKNTLTASILSLALIAPAALADGPVQIAATGGSIDFLNKAGYSAGTLSVAGPEGIDYNQAFKSGEAPSFSLFDKAGYALPDGLYKWQISPQAEKADGERNAHAPALEAISGVFTLKNGSVVDASLPEDGIATKSVRTDITEKAQTFTTDLIVQGSACVGFDCTTSESFGFDTLRLKENNLRIHFNDTSSSASFPGNDWRITINDSTNGGAEFFAVEDVTAGRTPFKVEAGAIANALYVSAAGDVGVGTSTPVVEVHAVDGNTPTLRLEQNGSSGFTPQTWDLAGNETNFFLRDVTNGSKLPFRVEPGAPDNVVYLDSSSYVGMGTNAPAQKLHLKESGGATSTGVRMQNDDVTWDARIEVDDTYVITENGTGGPEFTIVNSANASSDRFRFQSGGTSLMSIDSSGGVTMPALAGGGANAAVCADNDGKLKLC